MEIVYIRRKGIAIPLKGKGGKGNLLPPSHIALYWNLYRDELMVSGNTVNLTHLNKLCASIETSQRCVFLGDIENDNSNIERTSLYTFVKVTYKK